MPSVTLHLLLARRTLAHWDEGHRPAPFPLTHPRLREAFLQGAVGPDLGYFPGGVHVLSDLAHCVRSGDLARTLLDEARSPLERAFAWGWASHALADRLVHPLVGRGVGELRHGDRERFVAGATDTPAHVRVETGLDAWISGRFPDLRSVRFAPSLEGEPLRHLAHAYRETYGWAVDRSDLVASYHAMVRGAARALVVIGLLGRACRANRHRGELLWALAGVSERLRCPGTLSLAFVSSTRPPRWLRVAVLEVVRGFPASMEAIREAPDEGLPNVNLDTALPDEGHAPHAGRERALAFLRSESNLRDRVRPNGVREVDAVSHV